MTDDNDHALGGPVSYVVHVVMEQEWTEADNIYLVDVGIIVDKDKYPACYSAVKKNGEVVESFVEPQKILYPKK